MTYKNIKFDDSEIMRSFERVAIKKGLAKPEEIKKMAHVVQPTADLKPVDNLTQNIMKLCSGLRESGFNKYADEVEKKFLNLKQAQTLYETSKEKGEDLIDMAHPEGSYTLKDVDGDAMVETIVEQNKKIQNIISKTPKGKLASQDIINMVKIVLAEEPNPINQKYADLVNSLVKLCNDVRTNENTSEYIRLTDGDVGGGGGFKYRGSKWGIASLGRHLSAMVDNITEDYTENAVTFDSFKNMIEYAKAFQFIINKSAIEPLQRIDYAKKASVIIDSFQKLSKELRDFTSGAKNQTNSSESVDKFMQRIELAKNNLMSWSRRLGKLTPQEQTEGKSWIQSQLEELKGIENQLTSAKDKNLILPSLNKEMEAIEKDNQQFEQDWIA